MLLDDDVMAERETEPGAFARRLGGKERIKHLVLHLRRDAGAVVSDPDLHPVAEVLGRSRQSWFVAAISRLVLALGRCVEAIGDQIEQHPGDLLGEHVDLACRWVERAFQV